MFDSIRPRRASELVVALAAGAATLALLPAIASAACQSAAVSQPFAQFGDEADYQLAPGGTFESGAPGWSLGGSRVVEGNETYYAAGAGSHSLAIGAGGTAVSPAVCIGSEYPTFRFFVEQTGGGPQATLTASLRWVDLLGVAVESPAGSVSAGGAWSPSPVMRLGNSVPLWLLNSTADVQLVFRSSGGGSWAIDDVFIDPYSR